MSISRMLMDVELWREADDGREGGGRRRRGGVGERGDGDVRVEQVAREYGKLLVEGMGGDGEGEEGKGKGQAWMERLDRQLMEWVRRGRRL